MEKPRRIERNKDRGLKNIRCKVVVGEANNLVKWLAS
jgi:hypothetical protein